MTTPKNQFRSGFLPPVIAALAAFAPVAIGQDTVSARPYGQPSESKPGGPATLGLYHVATESCLRLEGGTPGAIAVVVLARAQAETVLQGGGTLLVGQPVDQAVGTFDDEGVFTMSLGPARFDADGDALFAQGMQPADQGAEFSAGLQLARTQVVPAPVEFGPPPPDDIIVEEFGGMLRRSHLEAALDLALNSKDDAMTLEIGGNLEVPVLPAITAGGKAAFKASLKRGEVNGTVVYDLAVGGDVAASAGIGFGTGGLGGNAGLGGDRIWRFASVHQAARAIRSLVVLQTIGKTLEAASHAVHAHMQEIDRAIERLQDRADDIRDAVRSHLPRNARIEEMQRQRDAMRAQRRAAGERARRTIDRLAGQVSAARIFLATHLIGFELRQTTAFEANLSVGGIGDAKEGQWTFANVGAGCAAGCERQFSVHAELGSDGNSWTVEHKLACTRGISGAAGYGIGVAAAGKRVIELSKKSRLHGGEWLDAGTTVKLTLDGRLAGVVGAIVTGQGAVGGEVWIELPLAQLLGYRDEAIAILTGADLDAATVLLRELAPLFQVRGRYEAALCCGLGIELEGVGKAGISIGVMLSDRGPTIGGQGLGGSMDRMLSTGVLRNGDVRFTDRLAQVNGELSRAMAR